MAGFEAKSAKQALKELGSSEKDGLSHHEAQSRLVKFGRNEVETRRRRTAFAMMLGQFSSPLVLILVFASILSGFMGEFTEAGVIVGIVVANAILGFVQEHKGEQALEKLARFITFKATVLRSGVRERVDAKELVPGDIVFISTGDLVPADMRLISTHDLYVNQSVLTGESAPAEKSADAVAKNASSQQEMPCIAFMGTGVSSGAGTGVVIATGKKTEFGRTAAYLEQKAPETDFEKNVKLFGEMLIAVVLVITVFIFAANALQGKDLLLSLLFALAIAVGITPEMLPIIITLSLSNGAMALAAKKVVVKRLDAIEDLGNVDVLCADKTGTLTENAIAVKEYIDADGKEHDNVLFHALLASPVAIGRKHKYAGMPMDAAIWEFGTKRKYILNMASAFSLKDEVAFDYERRMMSVVAGDGKRLLFVTKGSPESVIPRCERMLKDGREAYISQHGERLLEKYRRLSAEGLRVLAVAAKKVEKKAEYTKEDEKGLTFIGFVVFTDPPRKTASAALRSLKFLGVELKILSGDEPHVTAGICRAVGLEIKGGTVVTGSMLEGKGRDELRKLVEGFNVFARLTPAQKLEIVSALKENGHAVGFIGDGVNDAPALHSADCGISVDTGADIARESADVILLGHGLHVVVNGIMEGRKTFGNTVKYILNTISANFGNMFSVALASLFVPFLPLLPSQILLNNFVSDVPLMTISTDRVDKEDLRKPRKWSISGIVRFMVFFGLISSVFDLITMGFLIYIVKAAPDLFRTGWFLESTFSEMVVTFAIRTKKPFFMSRPSKLLVGSTLFAIVGALLFVYTPIAPWFEFVQPDLGFMMMIGGIVAAYFAVAETAKHIFYRVYKF